MPEDFRAHSDKQTLQDKNREELGEITSFSLSTIQYISSSWIMLCQAAWLLLELR